MHLTEALSVITPGRKAVLFLGAGFAAEAKNRNNKTVPSSVALSRRILEKLNIDGTAELSLAIDELRNQKDNFEAFQFLRDELTAIEITNNQNEIINNIPWHRIYTTNIDNIYKENYRKRTIDANENIEEFQFGDLIQLHGSISNCTPLNYFQKLKMGEQNYISGSHSQNKYIDQLQNDLFECDAFIIIGYNMGDPNLSTIFFKSKNLMNKCFVFSGEPDSLSRHRIELIGHNTNLKSQDFLNIYRNTPKNGEVVPPLTHAIRADYSTKEVTRIAQQNLLVFGRYDQNIARTIWTEESGQTYLIRREASEELSSGAFGHIYVLHGHLGNGKTLIFEEAMFASAARSVKTFRIEESVSLEQLKYALENIPPYSRVFYEGDIFIVKDVASLVSERNLSLCVSCRTTTFRVAASGLYQNTKGILKVISGNKLSAVEVRRFSNLISEMGFWPEELSKLTQEKRIETIISRYDSNLSAILVKIFENEIIKTLIGEDWNKTKPHLEKIKDHFAIKSYLQCIDVYIPPYIINQFQNIDFIRKGQFDSEIVTNDFDGTVAFNNAIIGEYVISNLFNHNEFIGAIVRFANFIDGHPSQRKIQWIVRRLLRFNNLARILKSTTKPLDVFDKASFIGSVQSDPLFWVQYSIAQLSNGNWPAAQRHVGKAYEEAKKRGSSFDTYQIDTHAARLDIQRVVTFGASHGDSEKIRRAVKLLHDVAMRRSDDTYHVSNVVLMMLESDTKWYHVLSATDHNAVIRHFKKMLIAIKSNVPAEASFDVEIRAIKAIERYLIDRSSGTSDS